MNTHPQKPRTTLKSMPWLIAAALLWPLASAAEGTSTADHQNAHRRARMVAFLNTTTPFGVGPFNQMQIAAQQLVDATGQPIRWLTLGSADEPLWTQDIFSVPSRIGDLTPVLAPDGRHLTPSQWWSARGHAQVTCLPHGTRYQFSFHGLVPDGVYTIWHFTDSSAGALASHPPADINNVFMASGDGAAEVSVLGTPGPATLGGVRPACTLTGSTEEFFVVLYHIDGQYCGPLPCDSPLNPNRPAHPSEVGHLSFRR